MLEEDVVEAAVGDAIYSLFHDQLYLPLRPLKLFCQTLLRHELCPDRIIAEPSSYLRLPEKQVELSIKIVKLGKTDFYAGKHLIPYISSKSLTVCYQLHKQIMESLGNPVTELKTESVTAYFVDIISASNALSSSLCKPRPHRLNITVETIIQTKTFDDALNIFMRRVLEETYAAGNSDKIVSAALCVTTENNNQHYLDIKQMRDKRQQVLTLLKAAICAEGILCLQFFVQCKERTLPVYASDYRSYRQPSSGYVKVTRTYQLTYIDSLGRSRCFTPVPLRSLACGVFFEVIGAQQLLSAYIQQTLRKSSVKTANREASALNMLIIEMSQEVAACWRDSEVMNGIEKMILLNAILEGGDNNRSTQPKGGVKSEPSHLQLQLKYAANTIGGHVRAIRDANESLQSVINLLITFILHNPALQSYHSNHALNEDERNELDRFFKQCVFLPACLEEVKQLLRELSTINTCTTLLYLQPSSLSNIQQLYDPVNPAQCLIPSEMKIWKRMNLSKMMSYLRSIQRQLKRLDDMLWTIETTISMEYISALLRVDLQSYAEYQILEVKEKVVKTTQKSVVKDPFPLLGLRDHQEAPRNFRDLLGFAISRSRDGNQSWKTAVIHDSLIFEHFGNVPANHQEDSYTSDENTFTSLSTIWDLYGYVGSYNRRRYGAIDRKQLAKVEILREAVPNAILLQSSKIRYLAHTQLLQALHAGSVQMQTMPRSVPRSVAMLKGLLPMALLASEPSIDLFALADKLLKPVHEDHLQLLDAQNMLEGPYKLDFLLPGFSGGILGNDRWLTLLGENSHELLGLGWSIPPLLPRAPSNSNNSGRGITWHVHYGMQTETAMTFLATRQNIGEIAMDELSFHEARKEHERQLQQQREEKLKPTKEPILMNRMPGLSARVVPTIQSPEESINEQEGVYHSHAGIATQPLGPIKLELIYIAEHDENQVNEEQIRSSFSQLILELIDSMISEQSSNSVWRLLCATIVSSANNNNSLSQHFEAGELAQDNNNDHSGLREVFSSEVGKNGEVVLSTMALLPHGEDALLSASELYRLLHQHGAGTDVNKSNDGLEANVTNDKGLLSIRKANKGRGFTKMAAQLFSPPAKSSKHTDYGSEQADDWSEVSLGQRQYLLPQEEAEEERTDPTFNDSARLYSENDFNRTVQGYLHQKTSGRSRVYVPIELHITLVGQQKHPLHTSQRDHNKQQGHSLLTKSTSFISPFTVSRLISSTLFFSSQAAKQIWQLITRIRGPALSLAVHASYLQSQIKQPMQIWFKQWQAKYEIAVITQHLPHLLHLQTVFFSYPALLHHLSSIFHACGLFLTYQSHNILSVSLTSLRLTLMESRLYMRELLSSAAAVMMRGGIAGAAALVQRAMRLLGLFPSTTARPVAEVAANNSKNKKATAVVSTNKPLPPRYPATISMQEDFHEDGLSPPLPATNTAPVVKQTRKAGNIYRRVGGEVRLQEDYEDQIPTINNDNNNGQDEEDDLHFAEQPQAAQTQQQTEEQADDSLRRILHAQPKRTQLAGELLLRAASAFETVVDCQGRVLTEALHLDDKDDNEQEGTVDVADTLPIFRPLADGLPLLLGANPDGNMVDPHTILSIAHRAQSATHLQLLDRPYLKHALAMLNGDEKGNQTSQQAIGYKFLDHHHEHTDVTTMLQDQATLLPEQGQTGGGIDATAKMKADAMAAVFDLSLQHQQQQAAFISTNMPAAVLSSTAAASKSLSGSSSKVSLSLSASNSKASLRLPAAQHKHIKQVALLQRALQQLRTAANVPVNAQQVNSSISKGLFLDSALSSSRDSLFASRDDTAGIDNDKVIVDPGINLKSSSHDGDDRPQSSALRPSTTQRSSLLPFPFLNDSRSTEQMPTMNASSSKNSSMIQLLLSDPTPKPFLTVFPDPVPRDEEEDQEGHIREEYRIRPRVDYAAHAASGGGSMLSMLRSAYGITTDDSTTRALQQRSDNDSYEDHNKDNDTCSNSTLQQMRSMAVQRLAQQRQREVQVMEMDHARFISQQPQRQQQSDEVVTLASET